MVALEVHPDLVRTEVVVLTEIQDFRDHIRVSCVRTREWPLRSVSKAFDPQIQITALPVVVGVPADPVVAAGQSPRCR